MQHDDRVNALAPFFIRQADHGDVLDQGMRADQGFDFGGIDVLAAGDDHVALAVGEMDVAVLVAAGHVADRAIVAAESFLGLLRQAPVAVERVGVAGIELAGLSVRHLVAGFVQNLDRRGADAFAADRSELGELLVRMQHGHPAGFGGAVELEQAGIGKHLHDLALGLGARGRRRDHQLGHGVVIVLAANGLRQAEHHDVVRRHQRGEGRAALGQRPDGVLGVKALARIDRVDAAAIAERAEEVQRVRMAHRHHQKRAVVAVQAQLDLGDHRQQHGAAVAAHHALRVARRAGRVHQRPRVRQGDDLCRLAGAAGRKEVLIGAVAGRTGAAYRNG